MVSHRTAYALLVLTMALWGGAIVTARGVYDIAPPVALTFWRWLLAMVLLLPFVWRKLPSFWADSNRSLSALLPLSCAMVLGTTLSVTAVNFTTAINATIINAAQAAMTALVAFVVLQERLVARQIFGIALAFTGILVMVFRGDIALLRSIEFNWGDLLMLGAIVSWAFYAVGLHRERHLPSGDVLLFVISVTGTFMLLPFYVLETAFWRGFVPSAEALGGIVYLSVASTLAAVYFWNVAIRSVGASRASVFVNLLPVFGAIFAMQFLGERLYVFHVAGAVLVFVGIVMAVRR
ncbi:MAG: DMT family transporter [Gammaproteobacteria bacterium]|nr:DMT family transporter [Gammaproteobacteria bacterium]